MTRVGLLRVGKDVAGETERARERVKIRRHRFVEGNIIRIARTVRCSRAIFEIAEHRVVGLILFEDEHDVFDRVASRAIEVLRHERIGARWMNRTQVRECERRRRP